MGKSERLNEMKCGAASCTANFGHVSDQRVLLVSLVLSLAVAA